MVFTAFVANGPENREKFTLKNLITNYLFHSIQNKVVYAYASGTLVEVLIIAWVR